MTDDTQDAVMELQIRLTHQEAAIEALTDNFLAMEKQILALEKQMQDVKSLLTQLAPSLVASPDEETPPPHY